ncbi:MAG: ATP-binding protein [Zavarzinia sp.]|nr:ATP-binding protein [Zavarzinia sp.]
MVFTLVGLLLCLGAMVFAVTEARDRALAGARAQVATDARLKLAVLRAEIEKHRSLPVVLAEDPDVADALTRAGDAEVISALNRKLETLSRDTRVGVIYVMDREGLTVAASNWREPDSFVGQRYDFRPYFKAALASGAAEHFALGTKSNKPGLYLARRLRDGLGVVVIKVEFDGLENEWAADPDPVLVTDDKGVVLLTDRADWRFHTLSPLDAATIEATRASLQFGAAPLAPLPVTDRAGDMLRIGGARFVSATVPVPTTSWTLMLLRGIQPVTRQAELSAALLALLGSLVVIGPAGIYLRRRQRAIERQHQDIARRRELEAEVEDRTRDLVAANTRLSGEIAERQQLQDELAQANRLAILGQIAASVAHEINQPVAAIRSYADNAGAFIDRGDTATARANLGLIAGLTEKIGVITGQLRNFARRAGRATGPVSLSAVVDGALLLLGPRLRRQGAEITRDIPVDLPAALGNPVRLEQVLVNLLQNALDAVSGVPRITIAARATADTVEVSVADNGPGLSPEVRARLFTPFVTTKPAGLGLGLVISGDIVKDLGGSLEAGEAPAGGALFTVRLRRA